MKYLLYYNINNDFVSDQVRAGGDGSNVVSVVGGVAWSNDIEKIHFNPHDETILTHTITVNYKNSTGTTIAPSETVSVDYISGTTPEILLQAKEIEKYVPKNETVKAIIPDADAIDFIYDFDLKVPLTFNVISSGTIYWKLSDGGSSTQKTIQYNKNNEGWTTITSDTGASTPSIPVSTGDVIQLKGNNTSYCSGAGNIKYSTFSGSPLVKFEVEGNIMSLIDSTGFATATKLVDSHTFYFLFLDCKGLVSAENLILPATTLATNCYNNMFQGCTSLISAPALPATTLASYCYAGMFAGCTSLTTAPELPATTLADYCYNGMFANCTSLTTAPELPVTNLRQFCYMNMFLNCTSLVTAPELPATTAVWGCYYGMFRGCTSLTTAPALPATTLNNGCYQDMFRGCTSLTTAPVLPATTIATSCYESMFQGCSSLNYIKCLATTLSGSRCLNNWVAGVSSTGTFVKDSISSWPRGDSGIPNNWTVQNA